MCEILSPDNFIKGRLYKFPQSQVPGQSPQRQPTLMHKGGSQHCLPLDKWPLALGEAPSCLAVSSSDSELGEGVTVREWAASHRNDRNCCLLIYFYLHSLSPQFKAPGYTMLLPLDVLSPPLRHLCRAQALARFTLPLCCHSCLLGGSTGGWYVWSPEGTESGLQWHVNPGSLRSPGGAGGGSQPWRDNKWREGGRGRGYRGWAWGIQCTNSQTPMLLAFVSSLDLSRLP